jgi:hypothetical protein
VNSGRKVTERIAFIEEGVHLLADDVAAFAGRTVKNLGVF